MAALAPYRCAAANRPAQDPAPLDYLWSGEDQRAGAVDLTLEAFLLTSSMRSATLEPHRLSQANLRNLYWTPAQLITHHTSNGCNLLSGDLLATGTVSGKEDESAGCLLELTAGGANPILLPNGERRSALEDGDEVILRGVCRRDGFPEISLGECRGIVLPAIRSKVSFIKSVANRTKRKIGDNVDISFNCSSKASTQRPMLLVRFWPQTGLWAGVVA
jgi:fumarylacetoacetase